MIRKNDKGAHSITSANLLSAFGRQVKSLRAHTKFRIQKMKVWNYFTWNGAKRVYSDSRSIIYLRGPIVSATKLDLEVQTRSQLMSAVAEVRGVPPTRVLKLLQLRSTTRGWQKNRNQPRNNHVERKCKKYLILKICTITSDTKNFYLEILDLYKCLLFYKRVYCGRWTIYSLKHFTQPTNILLSTIWLACQQNEVAGQVEVGICCLLILNTLTYNVCICIQARFGD